MKLNEKIYYYRTKSKMSQEQLAAAVGVSRQAVSKWELGDATPEVAKLVSLAKVFGITTDDLLSEDEPEQDKAAADLGSEAAFQKTAPETGSVRQEDWLDRMPGFLGNLFRRFGWLTGVYVALSGLGFSIVGGIARFMFGQFFRISMDAFGGFDGFGTSGFTIEGGENLPPEAIEQIKDSLGVGSGFGQVDVVSDMGQIFIGFANLILVVGIIVMIAGIVLALWLYNRGHRDLNR